MTLREIIDIIVDMEYDVIFCHEGKFYQSENWTNEELDKSELMTISEVDGITTFYFSIQTAEN